MANGLAAPRSKTKVPSALIKRRWGLSYTRRRYMEDLERRKVKRRLGIALPKTRKKRRKKND